MNPAPFRLESQRFPVDLSALDFRVARPDKKIDPSISGGVSVRRSEVRRSANVAALVLVTSLIVSAESQQKTFEHSWVGRRVVLKQPLYSLVYKERGMRGSTTAKRDGLTVVTPFTGIYFQFDGRHHVDNVTARDVQKVAEAVKVAYVKDEILGDSWVQVIDPVMLARYDPGTELVVRAAHMNLETVRLDLALATNSDNELATSLTVQWPAPLSKSFSERVDVEGLIHQFLTMRE
jgi:hypothetical protein